MDEMITPVTASETYLPTRRSKSVTQMGHRQVVQVKHWRRRVGFSPFFKQHRPASEELWISCKKQDGKEYEKERDGALCKAETQPATPKQRVTRFILAAPCSGSAAPDVTTYARPHFMRPSFLYSSTITALALASALARSFFLKHNLRLEEKAGIMLGSWSSALEAPELMRNYRGLSPP